MQMDDIPDTEPTVTVIVDSTSSLTAEHIGGLPLEVVPLQLSVGGRGYLDGVDITADAFYRLIADDSVPAQTAAPSPASYGEALQRAFESGRDVLCITTTSKLSATYGIATAALEGALAAHPERRGVVLDSGTAGGAEALVALAAARLASEGAALDAVDRRAADVAGRVYFVGILESLRRLQRGGRVPKAAFWAASLLNINPILAIWPGEGEVRMVARPRTRAKAVERVMEVIAEESGGGPLRVVVMHAAAPEDAESLRRAIAGRFACVETITMPFTPVIGAHTGPGLLGVAFHTES
ncbi:MAG: DegV family protein [Chloroflexota bacterium]|nr:DegV family protein [Chloroflexota bacterium]